MNNQDKDAINDVEKMVDAATTELNDVLAENPELKKKLEKSINEIRTAVQNKDFLIHNSANSELMKQCGIADTKFLAELEEAEKQAQQTALIINELKQSVNKLMNKSQMTEAENRELEEKNKQLKMTLTEFEDRTRKVQKLLQQIDSKMFPNKQKNCCTPDCVKENSPRVAFCCNDEKNSNSGACVTKCKYGSSKSSKSAKKPQSKSVCPADVETRLLKYSNTTAVLEKQVSEMEDQMQVMQQQLEAANQARQALEQQKKSSMADLDMMCGGPCNPENEMRMQRLDGNDPVLNEMQEQYNKLKNDYKDKITEVSNLRGDNEKLKKIVREAEYVKEDIERRLEEREKEIRCICAERNRLAGSKQYLVEQEQQLNISKVKFREAQDELEELRSLMQDQSGQVDEYRDKYLQAQEEVEEQRRQMDIMEMESKRVNEQVSLEIQRLKTQFQEKLSDLSSLPDALKNTQLKLQEAQQLQMIAEKTNETLMKEIQAQKDKISNLLEDIENRKANEIIWEEEKSSYCQQIESLERKCAESKLENDNLKMEMNRMEEAVNIADQRLEEKLHEITQLASQLESVREDSARHVARIKERTEMIRRSLQSRIADLERQLAQSRAIARSAQKERDEIRQKMQIQINNLNENFEEAQIRIRSLQGHVNILKSSYSNIFGGGQECLIQDNLTGSCNCVAPKF